MDEDLRRLLMAEVPAPLVAIVEVLLRFTGDGAAYLFQEFLHDEPVRRWSREPETSFRRMEGVMVRLLDGRIEPTDSEAAGAVLAFLRHLREYNSVMEADVTILGSPDGRQLRQFVEGVRSAVGMQRIFGILKATPGLFTRRFIDGAMILGSAAVRSDEGFEVRIRRRIGELSTAAEVCWLPLLLAYLALADARDGKLTTYDRPMVGRIHAFCEQGWQGSSDPRCLLDKDTVTVRNAHAHPANLQIDVVRETVVFLGKHSVGPLSDEQLRLKSEQMMIKLFTAFLALEVSVLHEVFQILDERGWTLSPGQPLLPRGSPSE